MRVFFGVASSHIGGFSLVAGLSFVTLLGYAFSLVLTILLKRRRSVGVVREGRAESIWIFKSPAKVFGGSSRLQCALRCIASALAGAGEPHCDFLAVLVQGPVAL